MLNDSNVEQFLAASGYPATPLPPAGVAIGRFGWTLEQAQGTTANLAAGTLINCATAVGDGDTAGTPGRLSSLLDGFSTGANPKVVCRVSRIKLVVSSVFAQGQPAQVSEDFLADLCKNVEVHYSAQNSTVYRFSFGPDGIGTIANNSGATDTTTASVAAYRRSPTTDPASWQANGYLFEANLESDKLTLENRAAIALPQGSTVRLSLWFDGAIVDNKYYAGPSTQDKCNGGKAAALAANLAGQVRAPFVLAPRT
jgi:hypothetical protein